MENKTDKEMSHKGIWWSECPGKFGTSQGHPGRLGRFMWKFTFKGQNVRGTDGTDDGTDGTCPQDRWDTNQGVPPKFLCLLVFFLSRVWAPWKRAKRAENGRKRAISTDFREGRADTP